MASLTGAVTSSCGASPHAEPADACRALAEAARRGARCDPQLDTLAEQMEAESSERACRRAARHLLDPSPYDGETRSIHATRDQEAAGPLTADELEALASLPLPGRLRLRVHEQAPATVQLDGERLGRAPDGTYDVRTRPGPHRLELVAAGERGVHCVVVPTCDELVLELRGANLADEEARPFVSDAACGRDPAALELTIAE